MAAVFNEQVVGHSFAGPKLTAVAVVQGCDFARFQSATTATLSMKKTVAIVQSNYIPWKGYFDLIHSVDEFILYDDMQSTRRDWRNRNTIKSQHGLIWLTIPVQAKGKYLQKIKDTMATDSKWARDHWRSIVHCYSKARHFSLYREMFEDLYLNTNEVHLSRIN